MLVRVHASDKVFNNVEPILNTMRHTQAGPSEGHQTTGPDRPGGGRFYEQQWKHEGVYNYILRMGVRCHRVSNHLDLGFGRMHKMCLTTLCCKMSCPSLDSDLRVIAHRMPNVILRFMISFRFYE